MLGAVCAIRWRGFSLVLWVALTAGAWAPSQAIESPKDQASKFYEAAVSRFENDDYDGAIIELKNALQREPQMLPAMALMGEVYAASGNGAAAETALNEAQRFGADVSLVAVPLAKAFLLQFKHDQLLAQTTPVGLPSPVRAKLLEVKARAALEVNNRTALKELLAEIDGIDPDSVAAITIKATLAMRAGKIEDAGNLIARAQAVAPDHPTVWLAHASLLHRRGSFEAALAAYARVVELEPRNVEARLARIGLRLDLGRDGETGEDFAYLTRMVGSDPRLAYLRAVKLARAGDEHGAKSALAEVASILEALRPVVARNLQLLMVAGVSNFSLGNFEVARDYLESYIALEGSEVGPRKMLAAILLQQKDYAQAIGLLDGIVKNGVETPDILVLLARAYTGAGNHERATAALERAVTLRGDDPMLATQLAVSRAHRGQIDMALGELGEIFARKEDQKIAGLPLAIMHMNRNQHEAAAAVVRQLLDSEPQNLTYLNLLAIVDVSLSRLDEAQVLFEKALAIDPGFLPARINLGKIETRRGDYAAAERRFRTLLAEKPDSAQIMLELARTAEAQGNAREALRWATDASQADPASFEIGSYLIDLHLARGDFHEAATVAWAQEKHHPGNLFVLDAQIRVLRAQKDIEGMRPVLKHMADLAEFDADWLAKISDHQVAGGLLDDALYTLFKAVQGKPDDPRLQTRLVEVELRMGRLEEAYDHANRLIDSFPARESGYLLLGDVRVARGQYAEAAASYASAFKRVARADIALKRHLALRHAGDDVSAEKVLTEWLVAHAADHWAEGALGEFYLVRQRYLDARAMFQRYLARVPDDASAINNLANVFLKMNNRVAALEQARRAYELRPADPLVNDTLGWILVCAGDFDRGLSYLREARTRAATVPEIRYHLAVALHRLGRKDEARAELDDALRAERPFDGREEALRLQAEING